MNDINNIFFRASLSQMGVGPNPTNLPWICPWHPQFAHLW